MPESKAASMEWKHPPSPVRKNCKTTPSAGLYGLPRRMGMLKDLSKFDNQFFRVNHKQAHKLDPQARILLEVSYESIVDAGYDPDELRGRDIGVFIGNSTSESLDYFGADPKLVDGYAGIGCARTMFANRISYSFDFKGPSFAVDTACSSSSLALLEAVVAMRRGECEAAIVGGANLCLEPVFALLFYKLNMLSDDGMCKSFDAACNGYARSEAVCALFLQRADVARRKYATIVHIKTNTDGFKEQSVTLPSAEMQKRLITEVYEECKLDPLKLSYVEAHGTGTPAGDPLEMSAIADVFCKGRKGPLLVGTVKSNMGHSEAASGICSIIKVLISMEKGLIPPNLHFNSPNPNIPALMEGHVKVVANSTPWEGEYAAFNSFGFGGVNVHGVLKSNSVTTQYKNIKVKRDEIIPQLVLYNGRTEESIKTLFHYLDENNAPREFFALLHKSAYTSPLMKPFRGYKLFSGERNIADIKQPPTESSPLWYVFSGVGSQWSGMAKQLMHLEVFANTIRNSAKVLEIYGLNLIDLVTNDTRDTPNSRNIIPVFVSIAAVQIALVNVLNELGLKPDGIVGHSVGELGCAYADGCLTAEQTVLGAYWRGRALEESNLQEGAMAALGMSWSEATKCCPRDINPACHNAEDSVTISGPKKSVKVFVQSLKDQNMFAREVDSSGYAFHSPYIIPAADKLQRSLEKIIPHPKLRTSRWVSSSYSEDSWNSPESKIADASYFVHNLVSPVLFYGALQYVPKNAIVVEIAPHHLLQAILKRAIGPNAEHIGLMKRNGDNIAHIQSSIGRLYTTGLNPDIEKLYPVVQFPVPRNTPMISPLIKWDHSETWTVAKWDKKTQHFQLIVEVNPFIQDSPDHYILDHCINGRYLYPAAGYVVIVWRAFAEIKNKEMTDLPVIFEDLMIHQATILSETTTTKFLVDVTRSGGEFEISESGRIVCTGRVYTPQDTSCVVKNVKINKKTLILNQKDILKEIKLRGYDFGPAFQGIIFTDLQRNQGLLKWTGNWLLFIDAILQFIVFGKLKRAMYLPIRIQNLSINPILHNKLVEDLLNEYEGIPVSHEKINGQCFAGGVQLNLKMSFVPRQPCKQDPVLEQYQFVPYNESCILSITEKELYESYIRVCSSVSKIILEMSNKNKNQIKDIMEGLIEVDANIANHLKSCNDNHVLLKYLCDIISTEDSKDLTKLVKNHVNSYLSERENDILSQPMISEIPLRNVIDVVLENITYKKVKIAEVLDGSTPLSSKIGEYIQTLGALKINYYIAHYDSEVLIKENLPHNSEVVSWDCKSSFNFKEVDLFVLKYLSCSKEEFRITLENAIASVKSDGFLAVLQRTHYVPAEVLLSEISKIVIPILSEGDLEPIFEELNLCIISKKSDSLASTLYLLRKTSDTTFKESIVYVSVEKYDKWVEQLREKFIQAQNSSDPERIWLVGEGSNHSGVVGLVNCLRQEPGGSSIRCVFTGKTNPEVSEFSLTSSFYKELFQKNLVMNVLKEGTWGSYRHILCTKDYTRVETEHAYLSILTAGNLSSLAWVDSPLKYFTPSEKDIICQVYYASLNFKDVMLASGKLSPNTLPGDLCLQDCIIGYEFSGRSMNGQRVMGIVDHKGMATTIAADPFRLWNVPDEWTLEEASTVPVAYSTAYYALISKGNLKKGESILIHSGSGGVGQAAIAIALSIGCEIFTSVGTTEKKEFLKKRFPQLQDKNFCNSRDTSFEQHVLQQTNGEGVDVVLNSLAGEQLKASLNCLGANGRFLEIGKYDLFKETPLGTAVFLKSISFHSIFLDALFVDKRVGYRTKKEVIELVKKGIADGVVKPLNTTLFNHDQAEEAFRYMANGHHIGKVVIKLKEEEPQKKIIPTSVRLSAMTRTACNPGKTYVIIGGLGGFGLELCHWLVERGAKSILLTSRSGIKSGYQQLCFDRWTNTHEANITASKLNASKLDEARELLELAAEHGPIGGIFNLALVLRDALMENQTVQNFVEVCEAKVQSTKNMDALSRELCPELDWFVCFSSVSCGRGNAGQSNYGYANSVMERICEERSSEGLPGLAIQWGAIGDVGVIQDTVGSDVVIGGTVPQRIYSCLSVLDRFLQQNKPVVSSFVPYQPSEVSSHESSSSTNRGVLSTVAKIFGIKDMVSLNPETSLGELGMDSLMRVELGQFLENNFELILSFSEMSKLKIKYLKELDGATEESTEEPADSDIIPLENITDNFKGTTDVQESKIFSKFANVLKF